MCNKCVFLSHILQTGFSLLHLMSYGLIFVAVLVERTFLGSMPGKPCELVLIKIQVALRFACDLIYQCILTCLAAHHIYLFPLSRKSFLIFRKELQDLALLIYRLNIGCNRSDRTDDAVKLLHQWIMLGTYGDIIFGICGILEFGCKF